MVDATAMVTDNLVRFGFKSTRGGAHSSRTIMLDELKALMSYVDNPNAEKVDYLNAIEEKNCLGKRSGKTRILTYRHLVDLYSLDPTVTVFRSMMYFWRRDIQGQPLLALLCAYTRDPIFRLSAPFILSFPEGATITRVALEEYIDGKIQGRFSRATLQSTAQNINSTWTKAGHLSGRIRKVRSHAVPTPGAVSYALLLGYLNGSRGERLFKSEYANLLDCSFGRAIELAEDASRKGWIVFKRVGDVIEPLFPNLINTQEMEWLREQG